MRRSLCRRLSNSIPACEDICRLDKGPIVYERLHFELESHVKDICQQLVATTTDELSFLGVLLRQWNLFIDQLQSIRQIFLYLDRTYVLHTPGLAPIFDLGLSFFRNIIATRPDVQRPLTGGLLQLILQERRGEAVDRQTIKDLVAMMTTLQTYDQFEVQLLSATGDFYKELAQRSIVELDGSAYIALCEQRLREEADRVNLCLNPSSRVQLLRVVEERLISQNAVALLEKSFESLMVRISLSCLLLTACAGRHAHV